MLNLYYGNTLYVAIPKTATRSTREMFFGKPDITSIGMNVPMGNKSFAFVRHPVERFQSAYSMIVDRFRRTTFSRILQIIDDPEVVIGKGHTDSWIKLHTIPMSDCGFGPDSVELLLRFEKLEEGWDRLAEYLDVPRPKSIWQRSDYPTKKLTAGEREVIEHRFRRDIEAFQYT